MFKLRTRATRKSSPTRQVWVMMDTHRVLVVSLVPTVSLLRTLSCLREQGLWCLFFRPSVRSGRGICSVLYTVQGTQDTKRTWSLDSENLQYRRKTIIRHSAWHGGPFISIGLAQKVRLGFCKMLQKKPEPKFLANLIFIE